MYFFLQVCSEIFSFFLYFEVENTRKTKKSENYDYLVFSSSFHSQNQQKNNSKILLFHNNKNISKSRFFSLKIPNGFLLYQNC